MSKAGIEDVYPLSPLQQGMLYHRVVAPESTVYFIQRRCLLRGALDRDAFEWAWQEVVRHHPALRTSFRWEGLADPLQVVKTSVKAPVRYHDWRALPPSERAERYETLARSDQTTGFDLKRAPLVHLTLIRISDDEHWLVWSAHHIVIDGWSLPLVIRDLLKLYEERRRGRTPRLEKVAPYRDYIAWLKRQDRAAAEVYWRQTLGGFTAPTALGIERVPSAGDPERYRTQSRTLSAARTRELHERARACHVTLASLTQGAWALLLARYSGDLDVVFGATVAGRPPDLAGVESMVGLFINTFPVRVRCERDRVVHEWLRGLQDDQLRQRRFEHTALVDIQRWSDIPRGQPLFRTLFVFENYPAGDAGEVASVAIVDLGGVEHTNYPLTCLISPNRELQLQIAYDARVFDDDAIARMLEHCEVLLGEIADAPERPLAELALVTDDERHRVLRDWNATARTFPDGGFLHERIAAQAVRTPDAIALVFECARLSYRELWTRVRRVAGRLREHGVGPDVIVGVAMERSLELVVALLGVLEAGGAYVPLDPGYPADRFEYMVRDAGAAIVLSQAQIAAWQELADDSATPAIVDGANLAYVIYTSGSTGRPKGAMNSHAAVLNRLLWMQDAYPIAPGDVVLQKTPYSFDVSVWEFFWPLMTGATLAIARPEGHKDPGYLCQLIAREQVTTLHFVPPMLAAFLEAEGLEACRSVRQVMASGEALSLDLAQRFHARLPWATLHNLYGPTEAAVDVTAHSCRWDGERSIPIGRPIANVQLYVLDAAMRPVPVGVAGELYIAGVALARGYLRRPGLTAERFVPDLIGAAGGRLYRTGDLARWRADGEIEYLGRNDHQVKIRGFRIELGEIEGALLEHSGVRDVVVVARAEPSGSRRLVAYWVSADPTVTVDALREHLAKMLPEYMVPPAFVALDRLPLNSSGKVDRNALPSPGDLAIDRTYAAPRTAVEQHLAEIWQRVLRVAQVGIHDNFYDLGGDSILGFQIISQAVKSEIRFQPKQLFELQTIAALAEVCIRERGEAADRAMVLGPVELAPIQRWLFEQDPTDLHHFNQAMLLAAAPNGPVAAELLGRSMAAVIAHHDLLRARFRSDAGRWRAEVGDDVTAPIEVVDFGAVPPDAIAAAIDERSERLQVSLSITDGPLIRLALFELGAGRGQRLLVIAHHLVIDAVSWQVLLGDLQTAYEQARTGAPIALPPKGTAFAAWTQRLVQHARSGGARGELEHWCNATTPAPLPGPRGAGVVGSECVVPVQLDADTTRALIAAASVWRMRVDELVIAALALALAEWRHDRAVRIDLEGHGRDDRFADLDVSRTVGWFTALYPVRLDVDRDAGPGVVLGQVKAQLRQIPRGGTGYGILRYLDPDPATEPLRQPAASDVLFNYLGQLDAVDGRWLTIAHERAGTLVSPRRKRTHALDLVALVVGGRLVIDWRYSADVHSRDEIASRATRFEHHLRALVHHAAATPPERLMIADVPHLALTQDALDRIAGDVAARSAERIESIDHLAPAQQGMLIESLAATGTGIHVEQIVWELEGELDPDALAASLQAIVDRHAILRTAFSWSVTTEPMQVALAAAPIAPTWVDLRDSADAEHRIAGFIDDDRVRGFELSRAPLTRLTVFRLPDRHRAVWTIHHLLIDGWCLPILFREFIALYEAHRDGIELALEPPRPYADYVRWLRRQSSSGAEQFWREQLRGFVAPNRLGREAPRPPGAAVAHSEQRSRTVPADVMQAVHELARAHRVTASTVMQATWALLLSRYSGSDDVVFGVTVAGRPPDLAGSEAMIGPCMNTVPLRLRVPAGGGWAAWLAQVHATATEIRQYEHIGGGTLRAWCEVPGARPLYESLLVYQNYPTGGVSATACVVEGHGAQTRHALTLVLEQTDQLVIHLVFDPRRIAAVEAERVLDQLRAALIGLAHDPTAPITAVGCGIPEREIPTVWAREDRGTGEPPRTDTERLLASLWSEVLGEPDLSREDDFFDLGGHSLSAAQVLARIRGTFGMDLPLHALFEAPRLADLAAAIDRRRGTSDSVRGAGGRLVFRPRRDDEPDVPITAQQRPYWRLNRQGGGGAAYNMTERVRVRGPFSPATFVQAFGEVARRHEVFRIRFAEVGGQAVQRISDVAQVIFEHDDLSELAIDERDARITALTDRSASWSLDLTAGPLTRVHVMRLAADDHVIVMTTHHIIADGWSTAVLLGELAELYRALAEDRRPQLAALPMRYGDYALWQATTMTPARREAHVAFWREQNRGGPPLLRWPLDHPRPPDQHYFRRGGLAVPIDPRLWAALDALCQRHGCTKFMATLAVFEAVAARETGQDDITIGTMVANRDRPELEPLIGLFAQTILIRARFSTEVSWREHLARVKRATLAAFDHQVVAPVEALPPERDYLAEPLFRVYFHVAQIDAPTPASGPLVFEAMPVLKPVTRYDLTLTMADQGDRATLHVTYNAELLERTTVEHLVARYLRLLERTCADPDATVAALLRE